MNPSYHFQKIPKSRIATFDISSIGSQKHHVSALLEFDVTESRKKLRDLGKAGLHVSFNGWLVKVISTVLQQHKEASAFLYNKTKLIIFDDINVSMIVEKKINDSLVPIPLVIEKTNKKSALEITREIEKAKGQELTGSDIVINKEPSLSERLYYHLPGYLRRALWRIMLRNPKFAYKKMGNAIITSVGMMGKINGWFIHQSIHPISFGVGSIIKKPVAIENEIRIREVLNMTILVDHDVIDGAPMVRFLNDLTDHIENAREVPGTSEYHLEQ
jgi:pyruvate/2-oxoglutarate dehydrogenase complex dihydrolipoamide acyltransferase (E2) component